jgi:hypothetical protein
VQQKKFPDPSSLLVIAHVLEVDITTVVLAAARSVGLDARPQSSDLAHLLPPGADQLTERMRDAILTLVRAAVVDMRGQNVAAADGVNGQLLEWSKTDAPSRSPQTGPTEGDQSDPR